MPSIQAAKARQIPFIALKRTDGSGFVTVWVRMQTRQASIGAALQGSSLAEEKRAVLARLDDEWREYFQQSQATHHYTAEDAAKTYLEIFGPDRFFIEIQDHGLKEQKDVNPELAEIAKRLGVGLIATNDVHYLEPAEAELHDLLLCLQTHTRVQDVDRLRFGSDAFYYRTPDEMAALFAGVPEALKATMEIAERCNVDLSDTGPYLPNFQVPDGFTVDSYFEHMVRQVHQSTFLLYLFLL